MAAREHGEPKEETGQQLLPLVGWGEGSDSRRSLRLCGFNSNPATGSTYLPLMNNQSCTDDYDVFLSYAHSDDIGGIAPALHEQLESDFQRLL